MQLELFAPYLAPPHSTPPYSASPTMLTMWHMFWDLGGIIIIIIATVFCSLNQWRSQKIFIRRAKCCSNRLGRAKLLQNRFSATNNY